MQEERPVDGGDEVLNDLRLIPRPTGLALRDPESGVERPFIMPHNEPLLQRILRSFLSFRKTSHAA